MDIRRGSQPPLNSQFDLFFPSSTEVPRICACGYPSFSKEILGTAFRERVFGITTTIRLKRVGSIGLIEIKVDSETVEGAKKEREKAVDQLREAVQRDYGVTVTVLDIFEEPVHSLTKPIELLNRLLDPILRIFPSA